MGGYSDRSHVGMMVCFYCGESFGVALDRRLKDTLPQQAVYNLDPCPECEKVLTDGGIIIIGTSTPQQEIENQRLAAKKEYDSWHPARQRRVGFNFVPRHVRLGMIAIAPGEPAQRWSEMFQGAVKPGSWTFIGEDGWNLVCEPALRRKEEIEREQSDQATESP